MFSPTDNLGCAPRGRPTDGPFNHKTGKGYVKGKKGAYHDALFVKRNRVDLLLHEDLGGGFSPPAAHKIRRLGRKSREHGVDRTPYKGDRKISFVSYHTRAISMNIVRATAWTLHDAAQKAKGGHLFVWLLELSRDTEARGFGCPRRQR